MRVAVLPTGRTELRGLGRALGRLFPGHEFYCLADPAEDDRHSRESPYRGFTSLALRMADEVDPPESACDLVGSAAAEALGDRRREAADLVLVVDDLELCNANQPARVVAVMRKAVEKHLGNLHPQIGIYTRTRNALLTKVSFHLIAPMIEAWFFADPAALQRAGVPAGMPVCFAASTDPEAFVTVDAAYLAATAAGCSVLSTLPLNKQKKHRPAWIGTLPRERHPKGYLQWLCRAPGERSCTTYSETADGGPALADIGWQMLLGRPGVHFQFLRALIQDLEDGLNRPLANLPVNSTASPVTARSGAPLNAVLRNL